MMPKIGQKITVVGILSEGKQGFWFAFNNWGAYGYAAKASGIAKENDLHFHFRRGQTVKVTGTLRYKIAVAPCQHWRFLAPPPRDRPALGPR
jgi:hypothetical protein